MHAVQEFFIGEWYFALPLVIMSLIAGSLVVWRVLLNKSSQTDMDEFLPVFQETLRKKGVKGAVELCKEEKGLIPSRLYVAGLEAADNGAAAMRRAMANTVELDINQRLHFLLAPILAIAKIATMVGLLFTVISMINTFNAIGEQTKQGNVKGVTGGADKIGLALFATALGLFTAIPLVFSHVLFKEWITRFEVKIKAASQKLVTLVTNFKKDPNLLLPPPKEEKEKDGKKRDRDRDRDEDEDEDRRERRKR
ncbi:MAG: MotA/TolQ/ExbB proton channel family protein [Gemmataceae bacterium]